MEVLFKTQVSLLVEADNAVCQVRSKKKKKKGHSV